MLVEPFSSIHSDYVVQNHERELSVQMRLHNLSYVDNPQPLSHFQREDRDYIQPSPSCHSLSELLLFLEEHGKANDRSINQQATKNRHDHCWDFNRSAVRQDCGES